MKKFFKKLSKPKKTFEEWAQENHVELPEQKPMVHRPFRLTARWISMAASFVLMVAFIIPFALREFFSEQGSYPNPPAIIEPKDPEEGNEEKPKIYSALDAVSQNMTLEEIYWVKNVLLFEAEQIFDYQGAFKDVADDDKDLILSYTLNEILFLTSDEENAFFINLRIRLYKHFEFYDYGLYTDLEKEFIVSGIQIYYRISESGRNEKIAHIRFAHNEIEYFLEVQGFEEMTEVTVDTLKILLNDLFT